MLKKRRKIEYNTNISRSGEHNQKTCSICFLVNFERKCGLAEKRGKSVVFLYIDMSCNLPDK